MSAARGASALGGSVPRRLLGSFAAGLCAALFAGCTSNAEPTPLPEPTASTAPSVSVSATPPALPPEAEGTSPRAAKAFARHYVDTVNYAMSSGDTAALEGLSEDSCRACQAITDGIQDSYANGGRLEGKGWIVRDVDYIRLGSDRALVGVALYISRQASYDSPQGPPSWSEATRGHLDLRMSWRTGKWVLDNLAANQ